MKIGKDKLIAIAAFHDMGKSNLFISRELKIPEATVRYWVNKLKQK